MRREGGGSVTRRMGRDGGEGGVIKVKYHAV